ncbi:hypothetical protein DYB37_009440 [Aphanomyces astaci]|uniref:Uncharacterized protein n=1 Tax=Aphanomyces astaci TaxID=112090 RepID=A0A397CR71_APHAT|nr:hypothetical protein DYB38_009999 [Aphanomyces astaci]RHY84280.1 hypothetical protein DYB26_002493 [Aphanomyces astaci]RHZ13973.1 hypothetical protein DYB37_009440 [Aphanomyces astaci]
MALPVLSDGRGRWEMEGVVAKEPGLAEAQRRTGVMESRGPSKVDIDMLNSDVDSTSRDNHPVGLTKAQKKKNRKKAKKKAGHISPTPAPVVPSPEAQRHIVHRLLEQCKAHVHDALDSFPQRRISSSSSRRA